MNPLRWLLAVAILPWFPVLVVHSMATYGDGPLEAIKNVADFYMAVATGDP